MKKLFEIVVVFLTFFTIAIIPIGILYLNSFIVSIFTDNAGLQFLLIIGLILSEILTVVYYITEIHGK